MVKIFYGMSGAFKGVTLSAECEISEDAVFEIRSMIKPWKDIMGRIFGTAKPEDHRDYALLHLCTIKNVLYGADDECPSVSYDLLPRTILVERGVTDSLYYWLRDKIFGQDEKETIEKAVEEELNLLSGHGDIKKILLVNQDRDFIENVVLREPHRSGVFPGGIEQYLKEQENYISWTSRWNDIDEVREIKSAREYIEGLGLEYIENK